MMDGKHRASVCVTPPLARIAGGFFCTEVAICKRRYNGWGSGWSCPRLPCHSLSCLRMLRCRGATFSPEGKESRAKHPELYPRRERRRGSGICPCRRADRHRSHRRHHDRRHQGARSLDQSPELHVITKRPQNCFVAPRPGPQNPGRFYFAAHGLSSHGHGALRPGPAAQVGVDDRSGELERIACADTTAQRSDFRTDVWVGQPCAGLFQWMLQELKAPEPSISPDAKPQVIMAAAAPPSVQTQTVARSESATAGSTLSGDATVSKPSAVPKPARRPARAKHRSWPKLKRDPRRWGFLRQGGGATKSPSVVSPLGLFGVGGVARRGEASPGKARRRSQDRAFDTQVSKQFAICDSALFIALLKPAGVPSTPRKGAIQLEGMKAPAAGATANPYPVQDARASTM
jgi:hypothetical protein